LSAFFQNNRLLSRLQHQADMITAGSKQTCSVLQVILFTIHVAVRWLSQGEAGALPPPPPKQGPRQLLAALVALGDICPAEWPPPGASQAAAAAAEAAAAAGRPFPSEWLDSIGLTVVLLACGCTLPTNQPLIAPFVLLLWEPTRASSILQCIRSFVTCFDCPHDPHCMSTAPQPSPLSAPHTWRCVRESPAASRRTWLAWQG
jgi:hypothetical protein